jgi:hypothetical protein
MYYLFSLIAVRGKVIDLPNIVEILTFSKLLVMSYFINATVLQYLSWLSKIIRLKERKEYYILNCCTLIIKY